MPQITENVKSNVSPAVAKASAERYVELLAGSADAKVHWRVFADQGDGRPKNFDGPLKTVASELYHFQLDKCGVFLIINGHGHKDMHIREVRAVFVDADDIPFPDEWHEEPDFWVIRDETHWHAYWLVKDFTVEQFTEVQKRLTKFYKTDPSVFNPSRVMRVPGFLHQKGDPIRVRLKENEDRTAMLSGDEVERRDYDTLTTFLPELTEAEAAVGSGTGHPMRHVPPAEGEDNPSSIEKAERYLIGREPAIAGRENAKGEKGNDWTYKTAAGIRDYGISAAMCAKIIYMSEWNQRCQPPWDMDELTEHQGPVDNAVSYGQNRSGVKASALLKSGRLKETAVPVDEYVPTVFPAGSTEAETSPDVNNEGVPDAVVDDYDDGKPIIFLSQAGLLDNLIQLDNALVDAKTPLFERGGSVFSIDRLTETKIDQGVRRSVGNFVLNPVGLRVLQQFAMREAGFLKSNGEKWVPSGCPKELAEHYLANYRARSLRTLHGIAQAPTLRADGSVVQKNGYDKASKMFIILRETFSEVPEHPTRAQAEEALRSLRHAVREVAFDGRKNRADDVPTYSESVFLAAVLTAVCRSAIRTAPLFGFSAPTKGSGKTLLADLVGIIATGGGLPVSTMPRTEEETEKRLFSILLAGDVAALIDNVSGPLKSDALNAILTQASYRGRILGVSQMMTVPVATTFMATGNNLTVKGDLTRRTLISYIDPRVEEPDKREFDFDARKETMGRRAELVTAALTLVRAWKTAQEIGETLDLEPYGSFEEWSDFVRSPLVWMGMPDPCGSRARVTEDDVETELFRALVDLWSELFGVKSMMLKDVVTLCSAKDPDEKRNEALNNLHEVLEEVAPGRNGGTDTRALGGWFADHAGRVCNKHVITKKPGRSRVSRWSIERIE